MNVLIVAALVLNFQNSAVEVKGQEIDQAAKKQIVSLFPGTKAPPKQTPLQEKYRSFLKGDVNAVKPRIMNSTAYLPTDGSSRSLTASGRTARRGIIAVDPRQIPMHSLVYVENYGWAVAGDTGGAIKGNIIDVCIESRSSCMNWGRRKVKVWVYPQKITSDLKRRKTR